MGIHDFRDAFPLPLTVADIGSEDDNVEVLFTVTRRDGGVACFFVDGKRTINIHFHDSDEGREKLKDFVKQVSLFL